MLFFLDDSYERRGETYNHILAGFTVSESAYSKLIERVVGIKNRYFLQDRNFSPAERECAWSTHFVVGDEPGNIELKASLLLSSSVLKRSGDQPRVALRIAAEILEALVKAEGRIYSAPSQPPRIRHGVMTPALLHLLDQVQRDNLGFVQVILDSSNPNADRLLARRFTEMMLSEKERFPTLSPTPFILDTKTCPALQIADLVAHIVFHRNNPPETRKPLGNLFDLVQAMEAAHPSA